MNEKEPYIEKKESVPEIEKPEKKIASTEKEAIKEETITASEKELLKEEKKEKEEAKKEVDKLMEVAEREGVSVAIDMARKMNDALVLDLLHDTIVEKYHHKKEKQFHKKTKDNLKETLKKTLFLVRIPQHREEEKEETKAFIERMEHVYSQLLSLNKERGLLKKPPSISLELASTVGGNDISFYVAVPSFMEGSFQNHIQGSFPDAVLEKKTEDYTIFEPEGHVCGAYLKLKKTHYLPINTYLHMSSDPLEAVTNALTKISPDEGSAVQVLVRPAGKGAQEKEKKFLEMISHQGKSISEAAGILNEGSFIKGLKFIGETFSSSEKKNEEVKMKVDEKTLSSIKERLGKPLFEVNIRIITASREKEKAEEILSKIEGSFAHFLSDNGFEAVDVKGRKLRKLIYDFSFRNFNSKRIMLLNREEVASVYHFPSHHIKTPYISWMKTREAPPPSNLPDTGPVLLGDSVFRGQSNPVYMASREDRRRHFYIVGQTGTGKSTVMENMIRQDIEKGEGVGVIDPHGELIEHTLANIPKERIDDVVLFEPFETSRPCGLNMLEWSIPEQRDFAVNEMIAIFMKLFPPEMIGPMFEHYMRNAMLALSADKDDPGTLVEIPRMFTDEAFMKEKVAKVTDPVVRSFWINEWGQTTEKTKSDMLGYVVSKIGRFINNEMLRNIIGQKKSSFDVENIMNEKKIFLANLSKGLTGEINSSLLGLILVSKMQIGAMRRARMRDEEKKDFYLYMDEFQNFTTDSISSILSEARKYRLNLIIANQYMPQLKQEIKDAIIGNVGSMACYRVGEDDAAFLESKFKPEFSSNDITNLDNYHFILKTVINNNISSPFKVKARRGEEGDLQIVDKIKEISKLKYGRLRVDVEEDIVKRSNFKA